MSGVYCEMCWEEKKDGNPCSTCVETSKCQVCGGGEEDPDFYLLCERGFCNTGLHSKCAPQFRGVIPEGRWICTSCEWGEESHERNRKEKKAKLNEEQV